MLVKRNAWHETQDSIDPDRFVFLDESSLKTDLARLRGWAEGGQRVLDTTPGGRWHTNTLIQAISLAGTRAAMVLDGPLNGPSFVGFCEWLLVPALSPGDIVVMDNLSTHKSVQATQMIEAVSARVVYLPPYSPDLNPIEQVFSKVKQLIRGMRPRTFNEIVKAAKKAIMAVTLDDIENMFFHCGYQT